jgi:hypothetical protein
MHLHLNNLTSTYNKHIKVREDSRKDDQIHRVQNIFEVASSSDSDVKVYFIVRN